MSAGIDNADLVVKLRRIIKMHEKEIAKLEKGIQAWHIRISDNRTVVDTVRGNIEAVHAKITELGFPLVAEDKGDAA